MSARGCTFQFDQSGVIVKSFSSIALGTLLLAFSGIALTLPAHAQDNYEIQVYGSEATPQGVTMVEIHSNFTVDGSKQVNNGVAPTNHAEHETLEITHGWTDWFESGFYVFTSMQNGDGWDWVGDHIRPRFTAPASWHWPVGVSISQEIGYQRRKFAEDTWDYELRPIIDKQIGRWYLDFNPTFDKSLHGMNAGKGWEFSPNVKVGFDFTKKITGGFEYYGALGPVSQFDPTSQQSQQLFPVIDLNLSPEWEVNFGAGVDFTNPSDHLIVKCIIGRRFSWGHPHKPGAP
jgi:hypothetical protein